MGHSKRNGRTATGHFAKGNAGGPGNPHAKRVAALREALLAAVTEADIVAVAKVLVARAKAGEVPAIRELLDRLLGKVTADATPEDKKQIVLNVVTNVPRADGEE